MDSILAGPEAMEIAAGMLGQGDRGQLAQAVKKLMISRVESAASAAAAASAALGTDAAIADGPDPDVAAPSAVRVPTLPKPCGEADPPFGVGEAAHSTSQR